MQLSTRRASLGEGHGWTVEWRTAILIGRGTPFSLVSSRRSVSNGVVCMLFMSVRCAGGPQCALRIHSVKRSAWRRSSRHWQPYHCAAGCNVANGCVVAALAHLAACTRFTDLGWHHWLYILHVCHSRLM